MDREAAAALVKSWALELGFDLAGVASLEPSQHGDALLGWLAAGNHAEMDYLERNIERRLEPASVLAGARSAVCVGLRYYPLQGSELYGDLWPWVARYARGQDYHDIMKGGLGALARRIGVRFPGVECRSYVDTGPVLERELAARAGLGAVGKNTNLLHPEVGSWVLLGELFTTLDLTADPPLADLCGSCRRCLEECPTGALVKPYQLDANLCLSYWTIEHRGPIPQALRGEMGQWVFGCDLCQEICPWNLDRSPVEHAELELSPSRGKLDLAALLRLSHPDYVEHFRGSAMKRAKRQGLQRNAAVVMGNRGQERYVPALQHALRSSPDGNVRRHAAWALGRIGGAVARACLEGSRHGESDEEVCREIVSALREIDGLSGGLSG